MSRSTDDAAGSVIMLALVIILLLIWLLVKAMELVVRMLAQHPGNKPLLAAVVGFFALAAGVLLTAGGIASLNALAGLAGLLLVGAAKAVELHYDPRFQPELDQEYVLDQVLHQPWIGWESGPPQPIAV